MIPSSYAKNERKLARTPQYLAVIHWNCINIPVTPKASYCNICDIKWENELSQNAIQEWPAWLNTLQMMYD